MELLDMAGHLIRRLHQTSTQIFQLRTKEAGFQMTPVQFAAMCAIREKPEIDQATIAALIAYDRATIGGVIDRLEQKGWVSRSPSKRDRRAKEVRLTEEGERILREAEPVVKALQGEVLDGLSAEERATFLALARKAAAQPQIATE